MLKRYREATNDKELLSADKKRRPNSTLPSSEYTYGDYTAGWICTLQTEFTAATAVLDFLHPPLPGRFDDPNTYTLGSIGQHNIVVACLPKPNGGRYTVAAATALMASVFPSIKLHLMVGVGWGTSPQVQPGDIVVSTTLHDDGYQQMWSLNTPSNSILSTMTKLRTNEELNGSQIPKHLNEIADKYPKLPATYLRLHTHRHTLFNKDDSQHDNNSKGKPEDQVDSTEPDTLVHYGCIASISRVTEGDEFWRLLNRYRNSEVLCIEREEVISGLRSDVPWVAIRGICEYTDSPGGCEAYAAVVAAAYAKEFLQHMQPTNMNWERSIRDIEGQTPLAQFEFVSSAGQAEGGHIELAERPRTVGAEVNATAGQLSQNYPAVSVAELRNATDRNRNTEIAPDMGVLPQPKEPPKPSPGLDASFQLVNPQKYRSFFKKGRVLKLLWVEPAPPNLASSDNIFTIPDWSEPALAKFRWFIVVQCWKSHCLAVVVHTYNGRGLTKAVGNIDDHAALVIKGQDQILLPGETLKRRHLQLIMESKTDKYDSASRIDFSKFYTIEYNLKVHTIGRIAPEDVPLLSEYSSQSLRLCSSHSPSLGNEMVL